MPGLKFQNGMEVDECTECWGHGGFWVTDAYDEVWESCESCLGCGYDSQQFNQYMMEQEESHEQTDLQTEEVEQPN